MKPRVIATLPIWGAGYVRRFTDLALPSLLAPGNLPALADRFSVELLIYTTSEDARRLRAAPGLAAAARFCEVRIVIVAPSGDRMPEAHGGTMMKRLHQQGFDAAFEEGAGFMPLCADNVYGDGSLAALGAALRAGVRAVMVIGVSAPPELRTILEGYPLVDGTLSITRRDLARHVLDLTGLRTAPSSWDGRPFTNHPATLGWPAGHGRLNHCFHLGCALIFPERHGVMRYSTDNDLAGLALTAVDRCAYLTDSDDFLAVGIDLPGKGDANPDNAPPPAGEASPEFVADWMKTWAGPFNREFFKRRFWLHDGLLTEVQRAAAIAAAAPVVDRILAAARRSDGVLEESPP